MIQQLPKPDELEFKVGPLLYYELFFAQHGQKMSDTFADCRKRLTNPGVAFFATPGVS